MSRNSSLPPSDYRGRLAPSPTGYLHIGHARTFWTACQRAIAAAGTLVMRMEDLDPDRSRAEYADAALNDLRWLGIHWQEGPDLSSPDLSSPDHGGPYAPYEQSRRMAFYLDAWSKLQKGGFLFPCRCSRKDLEAALNAPHESISPGTVEAQGHNEPGNGEQEPLDDEPIYPGTCRRSENNFPLSPNSPACNIAEPGCFNWRFRVPAGEVIEFVDLNLGPQRFVAGTDFGDFVVWRRDGVPSYQLACVADDAAMRITEVVRGEDLLKSTARQILLYRALSLTPPAWFHCRLVADSSGRRLAKRHDALSLRALRLRGFTPEQILSGALPMET
jgi:glutamyl-tRNA synthetase